MKTKGFTLIELLVVIAILAILTAAVVIVINPAQLLAQSRDTQRLSDLQNLQSAIVLYLTTAATTPVTFTPTQRVTATTTETPCTILTPTLNATTSVNGSGWVNINLTDSNIGAPLSVLPLDPTNTGSYFYAYCSNATSTTFQLYGRLESSKYAPKMATDGGTHNVCATPTQAVTGPNLGCMLELGTQPGLNL